MNIFLEILSNRVLIAGFFGYFTAQIVKSIIEAIMDHTFSFKRMMTGNGGMPSSHSATVCALATVAGFEFGLQSFEFAICVVFAVVVMTDASGVRRETGNQAIIINEMMDYFRGLRPDMPKPHFSQSELKELIGHTPFQVQMGGVLGIIVGIVLHFTWPY